MHISDFRSIVQTFADPGTDILFDGSQIAISVNGDLIDATVSTQSGDVFVDEGTGIQSASKWVLNRLARLPLLAARLRDSVTPADYFVTPAATLLPTIESKPLDSLTPTNDALQTTVDVLEQRSPLETTVLYLTSDAGEGKTSLINQLASVQAKRFTQNETDWLLVPIPLGGRHFLRFDDITIGALQNRYRFPFLYYNSFIALVKMGVIVPAFDGFEEMFVESSSGEALSAMGILVGSLESQGAIVVAARKAYFEFENLRTLERLFDTIRTLSVGFAKVELKRWTKSQFLDYCKKRGVDEPENIYTQAAERLGAEHALLTRAVLVRRLVDVATSSGTLAEFLEQLQKSGADFFSVFVRGLVEREANEKWLDRSGKADVGSPLLSVEEHCELLSHIALSMWESRVDSIKRDNLEFVADYFSECARKNAFEAQQIRERIRGHAMLIPSQNVSQAVEFDHDEFRLFFLGEGIARQIRPLSDRAKADVLGTFRRGVLPRPAQHAMIRAVRRDQDVAVLDVVRFLLSVSLMDAHASYTQQNCSDLVIRLLSECPAGGVEIVGLPFGPDALRGRKLTGVAFKECYFSATSMDHTEVRDCEFAACRFAQVRLTDTTTFRNVTFENNDVDALANSVNQYETWNPDEIRQLLTRRGVIFVGSEEQVGEEAPIPENDQDTRDLERIVRYFTRSTHMSESVILMKLSGRGQHFIDVILPRLLKCNVMEEIENKGSGVQRRFRLGTSLETINQALANASGDFAQFLNQFSG